MQAWASISATNSAGLGKVGPTKFFNVRISCNANGGGVAAAVGVGVVVCGGAGGGVWHTSFSAANHAGLGKVGSASVP
eukprot:scaffold74047_cov15-Tisochrysis_lutea.AAC.1